MSLRTINSNIGHDLLIVSQPRKDISKSMPIEGETFFQREAFKNVVSILQDEISNERLAELARRCFPLVDFLTKPRSVDEFQDLKKVILNTLWEYGQTKDILTPYYWMVDFCLSFNIFSNHVEPLYAVTREKSLDDIWSMYEKPNLTRDGKVISFRNASKVWELARRNEARFGLMCGKFRLGKVNPGYNISFSKAREALGTDGVLMVVLDGENILDARYDEKLARIGEPLRLSQIAESPGVNFATISPGFKGMKNEDVTPYMKNLWKKIKHHFYFVGSKDDPVFPTFKQRSADLGKILLYIDDVQQTSTSQVVKDLQGKF